MNSMGATWEMKNRKEIDAFRMCFGFGSFFLFLSLACVWVAQEKKQTQERWTATEYKSHTNTAFKAENNKNKDWQKM